MNASTPTDPVTPRADRSAADQVFRTALRDMLILLGALAVLGVGIGALVAGTEGVWGAAIGVGLALVFSGTTVVSMLRTSGSSPQAMAAVVMGAWLAKVIVVIVVLALITDMDFYSKPVLAVVLLVGVIGSAYLDYRAVSRGRIPYVEPTYADRPERRDDAEA
ncbi:TrbC/VirB2 family protein [Cellulomonas fengjieae]|uniref:TrbC/VirB2 family protein n=1 Tax=Cellulomonas fengjieae TaxID=2819978 RepID=A0ABS3SKU5_9CELL|nr:TrbC/VirB2 family protein [Cellulomonas fengjieae]MBO3086367.1 TrbC/VirB2 family protein [Cellulomonas fengjieae]MBO3100364.1 TrbC/VirB2 family protein [Cellulomonas fengjieae]QVI66760.1 TrbC/VirB2 family protein [Cellulomonas fengjieae]